MTKKIKNKSSIVRIIISNYDEKKIKEFKVLYTKQGGVDSFKVNDYSISEIEEKEQHIFKSGKVKERNGKKIDFKGVSSKNKNISIEYKNGDIYVTNGNIRKYMISGVNFPLQNENNQIKLIIKDLKYKKSDKRREESFTNKVLLNPIHKKNYEEIKGENIDSLEIYKIKRFFSYRSDMLVYFALINDFFMNIENLGYNNIYEIKEAEGDKYNLAIDKIVLKVKDYISEFIKNNNNAYENYQKKKLEREKEKKKTSEKNLIKLDLISDDDLKEDIQKIIKVFINLRNCLLHYNYKEIDKLYTDIDNTIVGKELNLNIFNYLDKIKDIKEEKINNFLEKEDTIYCLGATKKAQKLYTLYYKICNRKNGFNNFINLLFTNDGEEDPNIKEKAHEIFKRRYENLKKLKKDKEKELKEFKNKKSKKYFDCYKEYKEILKEHNEMKFLEDNKAAPYVWDIANLKYYKKLYNTHKEKSLEVSKEISSKLDNRKERITKLNKEILEQKREMKKITKLNAKYRLQYKLQVAFAFLVEEYNNSGKLDLSEFMQEFQAVKMNEKINEFKEKALGYLDLNTEKNSNKRKSIDLNNLEKDINRLGELSIFSNDRKNSLVKFYILAYLFLPKEAKGDFLGFVKKSYYDRKNLEFNKEYQETEEREKDSPFYHDLRLFEKNSKKYEIINYSISDYSKLEESFEKIYKKLGLDSNKITEYVGKSGKRMFDTNIILPFLKNYKINFKFFNDMELLALFNLKEEKNLSNLEESINLSLKNGYINFQKLIEEAYSKKYTEGAKLQARNDIAHFSWHNLFIAPILKENYIDSDGKPHRKHRGNSILEIVRRHKEMADLDSQSQLGFNMINDYKQRKKQFLFNLKKEAYLNSVRKESNIEVISENNGLLEKENIILDKWDIQIPKGKLYDNLDEIFKFYLKIQEHISGKTTIKSRNLKNLEVIIEKGDVRNYTQLDNPQNYKKQIDGALKKEASKLLGIYKKYAIKRLKLNIFNILDEDLDKLQSKVDI